MKRVHVESVGNVVTIDVPVPEPGEGQALVRTLLAGICGSDTHAVEGHHPLLPPPYVPGHEAVGVVEKAPAGGAGPAPGTRVVLKPNVPCGQCINCREDRSNACQTLAWIGCDPTGALPGAMSEYFIAPVGNLYELDGDSVTDEQAALVECLATPVHAARVAGDLTDRGVVIIGAGTIGLLMLIAAREAGAGRIIMTDIDEGKLQRAGRLGADGVVDGARPDAVEQVTSQLGGLADVVFDCVATEVSARQWVPMVRRSATICVVGVPPRDFVVPMPWIQDWELRVQGSANYNEADFVKAISMASSIPADEIVASVRPYEEAAEAFVEASLSSSGKVLVSPEGQR